MRIVQVVPGSGDNFYCENCVRDNATIRALHRAGHDVVVVPMYLPQRIDANRLVSDAPIFFGGVNAYLQQRFGIFRHTPRWLDKLFDCGPILRFAAKRAGSVRARGLGEMTHSILAGRDGKQAKEVDRLLDWLADQARPDVVHLSNPLLLGLGRAIKERLGAPVVCSLQDEDVWLDAMEPAWAERCWRAMNDACGVVDGFIAVSESFGDAMKARLDIGDDRMHVAHIGIDADATAASSRNRSGPPVIGYLARMSRSLGLGVLIEAFLALRADPRFAGLTLRVSGGSTGDDHEFLAAMRKRLTAAGAASDVEWVDAFDRDARRAFFESLTVFSVPTQEGTAFGTYLLEALAAGVPVVQPNVGAFPELIDATGGGILYDAKDLDEARHAEVLASTLGGLLGDADRVAALGDAGRRAVLERFSAERMVDRVVDIYGRAIARHGAATNAE